MLLAVGAALAYGAQSKIDTAHAFIQFRISHLGYSWLVGRFNGFNGQFSFDAAAPETTRITVDIDPASIDTNHSERDIHLRSKDFLAVTDSPDARFESDSVTVTGADTAQVRGRLTLRGVTKDIVIAAERIGEGSDPWGGHRAGFYGTTTLTLADFGIPTTLDPGGFWHPDYPWSGGGNRRSDVGNRRHPSISAPVRRFRRAAAPTAVARSGGNVVRAS